MRIHWKEFAFICKLNNYYKLIYFCDFEYFQKLNSISKEISHFKSDPYANKYELEISRDIDIKLNLYQPLPTNRSKRSRLFAINKSNCLTYGNYDNFNVDVNQNSSAKKEMLKKVLVRKNLK